MYLSIKTRQVAGVASLVGLVVVALSVLHLLSLARVSLEESRSRGEMLAHVVFQQAREVVSAGTDPYEALQHDPGIRTILESSIAYSRHVTYAALTDARGVAVAHSFTDLEGREMPAAGDLDVVLELDGLAQLRAVYTDQTLELRRPLLLGDREFGSIRIGVSTLLVRSGLQDELRPAAVVALVALVVATIVAMLLAQWILRPMYVIGSSLTRLGRGEFDVRLDLPAAGEFRGLGDSLLAISERLTSREAPGRPAGASAVRPGSSRAFATLGRLFGGLAHEVKNPLNAMTIHLELLRQKLRSGAGSEAVAGEDASSRPTGAILGVGDVSSGHVGPVPGTDGSADVEGALRHAAVIGTEIKRLDQVLQDFLKFVRAEEIDRQPVDVAALVSDVIRIVEPEAQRTAVTIRGDCHGDLPSASGDPGLLKQALLNLALNACQAMPDGGVLRLTCRPASGRRVLLTVEDTGPGIPPDALERIFDLFYTTRQKGSGVGLPMVYRTIQLHDGEIEVQSAPGAGTVFRLFLPQA